MVKIVRDPVTGLTPQQEAFAVARAKGYSQADAYRLAVNVRPTTKDTSIHVNACKMAADHNVKQRVRVLLSESRIADLDSVGEAWDHLLKLIDKAEDEGNMTAVAALMRQRLTGLGAMKHDITITHRDMLSDGQIIKRLAGDDERKAAVLRSIVGSDSFDEPVRH